MMAVLRWLRKFEVAHADRLFHARLRLLAQDEVRMSALSSERREYVLLALRAMDWWISSGRSGQQPPSTIALQKTAPPRNKIIVAYLATHPAEDFARAFEAIRAQTDHLANH